MVTNLPVASVTKMLPLLSTAIPEGKPDTVARVPINVSLGLNFWMLPELFATSQLPAASEVMPKAVVIDWENWPMKAPLALYILGAAFSGATAICPADTAMPIGEATDAMKLDSVPPGGVESTL